MRRSGGGEETEDDEEMPEDESAGSTAGEDSSGGVAVDWLRLEELSSAKMLPRNKETLGLVKRGVGVSVTRKEDMVENILCTYEVEEEQNKRYQKL